VKSNNISEIQEKASHQNLFSTVRFRQLQYIYTSNVSNSLKNDEESVNPLRNEFECVVNK